VIWGGLNWKTCGYCCYPFLSSHKNEKIKKKVYIKRNPKNNRSEKRMLECRRKVKIGLWGAKM
jgi:hypothetical protein